MIDDQEQQRYAVYQRATKNGWITHWVWFSPRTDGTEVFMRRKQRNSGHRAIWSFLDNKAGSAPEVVAQLVQYETSGWEMSRPVLVPCQTDDWLAGVVSRRTPHKLLRHVAAECARIGVDY